MFFNLNRKISMPTADEALSGRSQSIPTAEVHYVNGRSLFEPYPDNTEIAMFGGGCFWGVEKQFWKKIGIYVTAVGYSGGFTPNPSYQEVCTGKTGHNEVVRIVFYSEQISYQDILQIFWECHDPTQGMRQGNDVGTQYRSGIYAYGDQQMELARDSHASYSVALKSKGFSLVTTEIVSAGEFYFAESEHQQYLAKNPFGYCGLGGTGVCYVPAHEKLVSA